MSEVLLMTLDPGHFHAALVQKDMVPGVGSKTHVYAPLGSDLIAHLNRIAGFNSRKTNPTAWNLEVHTGPDSLARMLKERPGNVVVMSGNNRHKIDAILAAVRSGLHVLADKPWIISAADLPKLEAALNAADDKKLIAYDIMTERHEITSLLQKELVNDPEVFGTIVPGTAEDPGVFMESVHYLMKLVAGVPNRRPPWFFDIHQQGEGLTDVGTHLVNLVPWMLFPNRALDCRHDIVVGSAKRWPTVIMRADFQRVTGEAEFPDFLAPYVQGDWFSYFCNNVVSYTLRGIYVKLNILWDFEAPEGGGDTHLAVFKGSLSRIEVRQGKEQNFRPELYVVPEGPADKDQVRAALEKRLLALQSRYPRVAMQDLGDSLGVIIPDRFRIGHEAHFGEVTGDFLSYLQDPRKLPAWEKPNMLAKYYVTTRGVEFSREESNASRGQV